MSKGKKLKLTEIEQKLVLGSLAQLQLAAHAHQRAQIAHNEELARIAGAGYTLEQREGEEGIFRRKVEKKAKE